MANQLPVDTWRNIIGYHPWHFWGLSNTDEVPVSSKCNTLVREYAWQNTDQIGRSEIKRAIEVAESRLSEHLNYFVGHHFAIETLQYPRPRVQGHQFTASVGADGRWLNIRLNEGYIRSLGVETRDVIEEAATIAYTDADSDGLQETATITVTTAVTDVEQIAVYFSAANRLDGAAVSERWRIQPVQITLAGGVATIIARKWLFVKPIKYEGITIGGTGLDPATADNFVLTVDVYRRYSDPTGITEDDCQALMVWETEPWPDWATCCAGDNAPSFTNTNARDPAAFAFGIARAQIRDARLGEITAGRAVYDSDTEQWIGAYWGTCRQPDRIIVRYEAGAKVNVVENTMNQSRVDGRWDEIVARLAAVEMTRRICACDVANRELYRWQFDLARSAGANDEQYRISDADLGNPLGTRAGAVYAWRALSNLLITRSYLL